jgi:xylulokinase
MAKDLLLGIDIGTSGCKIAIFSRDGKAVSTVTEEYPVYYPAPGCVEQDPDDWWNAVCRGTKKLLTGNSVDPADIAGVGVGGQSWAAIAVDSRGEVLMKNPIWMDTRSEAICRKLNDSVGADELFAVSGNPLKAQYTTGKILWYKEKVPEVYKKIDKILQSNSFIVYRMTGVISQDASQGYGLHCFNMRKCCWDRAMCASLGINYSFLPEILGCHEIAGNVTRSAAQSMGLKEGTPVVAGGLDAACGTLGAGVLRPGQTQEQGGQAGGMSICVEEYCADPRLILSFHVAQGKWLLQGGTTGGGGAMRWFNEQFGYEESKKARQMGKTPLALLDRLAETAPPGSGGVVFLPYLAGERSPIWDEKAKGVFYGLDYSKTKAHMARAVMEGVAYSVRHNLEVANGAGAPVGIMRSMGGAANSRFWTQMKADITGKPIEVPATDTATTLGAALLAGVGTGVYRSFDEAVKETVVVKQKYEPDVRPKEEYDHGYEIYLELYESLKNLMDGQKVGE